MLLLLFEFTLKGGMCVWLNRERTPHKRPHAGNKLDDLPLDTGICTLAKGWVV